MHIIVPVRVFIQPQSLTAMVGLWA